MPTSEKKTLAIAARFGHGGAEPYERALRVGTGPLRLVDASSGEAAGRSEIDVRSFTRDATGDEVAALARTSGAVLDVGCGPGRMVHAAIHAGRLSLGVDLSPTAIAMARERGLPVLLRSVFDVIPSTGSWGTVLLLDGNIGIGGDPEILLDRCAQLMDIGGSLLIETHAEHDRHDRFDAVLVDAEGRASHPFPWSEIGAAALGRYAFAVGLRITSSWSVGTRQFSVLGVR